MPHKVVNAIGSCFTESSFPTTAGQDIDQKIWVQELFGEVFEVGQLSSVVLSEIMVPEIPYDCGKVGYKLANETLADIVEVQIDGQISILSVSDSNWVGTHNVQFMVYLRDIDPKATLPWLIDVTMTVKVSNTIAVTFIPAPVSVEPIKESYFVNFDEIVSYTFNFTQPLIGSLQE